MQPEVHMRTFAVMFSIAQLIPSCSTQPTAVRATLDDGQVLVGDIQTEFLILDSNLGALEIPLSDVGEVEPVEGSDLAGSGDNVRVWLRNGSELVGKWAEPELAMGIEIGGGMTIVDLPMNDLRRFQLQGATRWPEAGTFQMRTVYGDDLFVDAENTTIPLQTELGRFDPLLSECVSLALQDAADGTWRIELLTGTVLVGTIASDSLVFGLPIGPESVEVPLTDMTSLRIAHLQQMYNSNDDLSPLPSLLAPPAPVSETWYDVSDMRSQKRR
ncbi:MAG: hypothetical protein ACI9MC_000864 [Kiritimatiellia bacterium]|jgi:hypothetical protein